MVFRMNSIQSSIIGSIDARHAGPRNYGGGTENDE